MKFAHEYRFLKKDLIDIEKTLRQILQAKHPILREASMQLLQAGGKRIRPVFVLLSGQMGNYEMERLNTVAVSLELIHMATLVHDDVVDNSGLRRGKPTVKQLYGTRVAMYTGDYILACALEKITLLKEPKIHQLLSSTLVELCLGEIDQIECKYHLDLQLRDYLRRIKRKTALLIATSCKLGAMAGNTTEEEANRLYKYGYYIGMSYQIIDDILDITSTEERLGKPTASDLLQGNITLPVLFALQNQSFKNKLSKTFGNPKKTTEMDFNNLLSILKETGAIEASYQMSERYLSKALKVIEPLPKTEAKQILQTIAKAIGERKT